MPYEDSFFDVVYSTWVIEHLKKPENFLEECLRVLKPKGTLILWVPNVKNLTGFGTKIMPHSLKLKILNFLDKKPINEVATKHDWECYYRANSVRKLDRILSGKFKRIFLERHDAPLYWENYRLLTFFWYIRHKLTKNRLLKWTWPSFYVEYEKL